MPNVTYITDRLDNELCIQDYGGTCIVLRTHVPIPGCDAVEARIWLAGLLDVDFFNRPEAEIRLIEEL
jgi:hypothetical protein